MTIDEAIALLTDVKGRVCGERKKKYPDAVKLLESLYEDSNSLTEIIYRYKNGINEIPLCKNCNKNKVKFKNFSHGYRMYCCYRCSRCEETMQKMKNTNLERYGGIGFKSEILKEKYEKTSIALYGENWRNDVQQKHARQTKLEKYGDENYNNREKAKANTDYKKCYEKYKLRMLEKYGVDNYFKSEECRKKCNTKIAIEKRKVSYVKTMKEKYGVECPFQLQHVRDKMNTYEAKLKMYKTKIKHGTIKRSSLEDKIIEFIKSQYDFQIETNSRKYLNGLEIDIYIPKFKIGIEIQGDFFHANPLIYTDENETLFRNLSVKQIREKDKLKFDLAASRGIKLFYIWEFDIKNNIQNVYKQLEEWFQPFLSTEKD